MPVKSLSSDIRGGLRQWRRAPVVTGVALMMLTLGIGANTAIFSLVNAVYLKTLPIDDPARLVRLTGEEWFSTGVWAHIRDHQPVFDHVAAAGSDRFNLARGGLARYAPALVVSGRFFEVLGIAAARGRFLSPDDDAPGAPVVAVISHGLWQREFGGSADAVGSAIWLEGVPFQVIGVMPRGFVGIEVGRSVDVVVSIAALAALPSRAVLLQPHATWLHVFARLRADQTTTDANGALRAWLPALVSATRLAPAIAGGNPAPHLARGLAVAPAGTGISEIRTQFGPAMLVLFGLVAVVTLVACANLAALSLARFVDRLPEMAVRRALGASRWDLARVLFVENLMVVSAGALLGAMLAAWATRYAVPYLTTPAFRSVSPHLDVSPDWRLLGMVALLTLAAAVLAAALPARRTWRVPLEPGGADTRSVTGTRGALRSMQALLAGQLALSLGLLGAALLLGRSFLELTSQEIGIDRDRVTVVTVSGDLGSNRSAQLTTIAGILRRLQGLPGLEAVAASMVTPISGQRAVALLSVPGVTSGSEDGRVLANRVSPDHFRVYGTPLLTGRDFDERDSTESPPVAIVTRAFADRYFGGGDPVGRTILLNKRNTTIIGMVADAKQVSLRDAAPPFLYAPISQWAFSALSSVRVSVRAAGAAPAPGVVAAALGALDSRWSLEIRPFAQDVDYAVNVERLLASCGGLFAVLSILMGAIGTSGMFGYSVARRRREFGVRMAIGAAPRAIVRLVMKDAVTVLIAGLALGVLAIWMVGRTIEGFLFQISSRDPATLIAAMLVIVAIAGGAAAAQAVRAATLHPMKALRGDSSS